MNRKAERIQKREEKKKKYEKLAKRNEDRMKEKEQKLKEIAEEIKKQEREEKLANKDKREKWKEEHDLFLQKQKENIEKEMTAMVKEREELKKIQEELKLKEKATVENVKSQVIQYFDKNKDKLNLDKKEKEEVIKFLEKPSVKAVLDKFNVPLKYFFEFYSRSEHHEISSALDDDMETMNYKEFIRFGYQSNIVPTLFPIEELNRTFKLLVRERQDETKDTKRHVIDYGYFLKAIVRIAAIAQDYLGGQKGQKLEKRMEDLNLEKQKNAKLKETLAKKYGTNKIIKRKGTENSLDRDKGAESGNETGKDSQKSDKPELHKRGAKKPRAKVIKEGFKDATLKNATALKNVVSEAELLNRKSKNVNLMLSEGTKVNILDNISRVKCEDKRVTKSVDVDLITSKTIEGFLAYLNLLPEDNKYTLDKKLNQAVRQNVGVKPNKIIKQNVPQKADAVDKDSDDDNESGRDTNRSRTEKTEKTEKTDDEGEDEEDDKTTKN